MYLVNTNNTNNEKLNLNYSTPAAVALMSHDTEIWHRRLGHLNFQYMKTLRNKSIGVNFKDQYFQPCETCIYGKQTEQPYKRSSSRAGVL